MHNFLTFYDPFKYSSKHSWSGPVYNGVERDDKKIEYKFNVPGACPENTSVTIRNEQNKKYLEVAWNDAYDRRKFSVSISDEYAVPPEITIKNGIMTAVFAVKPECSDAEVSIGWG